MTKEPEQFNVIKVKCGICGEDLSKMSLDEMSKHECSEVKLLEYFKYRIKEPAEPCFECAETKTSINVSRKHLAQLIALAERK